MTRTDDRLAENEARRQVLAEVKRLRARGEVLIGIAKDRDQQMCPPGTVNCPRRFFGTTSCTAACWDAWYASTDDGWKAILEGKDGEAE